MQAAEALNLNHMDPKLDKPRNRALVKMRVINRNTRNLGVMAWNTIGPGEHIVTVYEDEVDAVRQMVEPRPEAIEQARADLRLTLAKEVLQKVSNFQGTAEDMAAEIESGTRQDVKEEYQRVLDTTSHSLQGEFHSRMKRDIKPLTFAEKIEGSEHAEPQKAALDRELKRAHESLASALREVGLDLVAQARGGAGGPAQLSPELLKLIDERAEARVKELLGEKGAAAKK